jgi:hypothetical protein
MVLAVAIVVGVACVCGAAAALLRRPSGTTRESEHFAQARQITTGWATTVTTSRPRHDEGQAATRADTAR